MSIAEPWSRVKKPIPIPDPIYPGDLLDSPRDDLAELLRSNLLPRPDNRPAWTQLWRVIDSNDDAANRAMDILEDLIGLTDEALAAGELDEAARKRAEKFRHRCDQAWLRLDRGSSLDPDEPLAWAGRAAKDFSPPARKVIHKLVSAIDEHRSAGEKNQVQTPNDAQLWAVLHQVSLDPRRRR